MDRLVTIGGITKNRFIAFLDIMGVKKLLKTVGVDMVYALYAEIDDITKVYRDNKLIITYYSDSIMAATTDDSVAGYESLVLFCAQIEAYCIKNGYAVNGAISYGTITIDKERNIWLGEPLSWVYDLQNKLFFYGIVLDEQAYEKAKDIVLPVAFNLTIPELVTGMIIPIKKEGWIEMPCVNWFEFIGEKIGKENPYQDQIGPMRKYVRALYEKYKDAGGGYFYISNTEMVLKKWYDFLGERSGSTKWGNLILEDYVTGKHYNDGLI